jgi:hypothetical protein
MSRPISRLPERLRAGEGTELEQRLLESASREQPPRALSERMAGAIGVAAPVLLAPMSTPHIGRTGKRRLGSRFFLLGIVAAAVALGAGGATVLRSPSSTPQVHPASLSSGAPVVSPPVLSEPSAAAEPVPSAQASALRAAPRPSASASASDLREQITLIDAARSAVSAGQGERALEILRQYQTRCGTGSFRPEASALKVEALVAIGRDAEAHALAERFVAQYRGSPLAERVARVAGLQQ